MTSVLPSHDDIYDSKKSHRSGMKESNRILRNGKRWWERKREREKTEKGKRKDRERESDRDGCSIRDATAVQCLPLVTINVLFLAPFSSFSPLSFSTSFCLIRFSSSLPRNKAINIKITLHFQEEETHYSIFSTILNDAWHEKILTQLNRKNWKNLNLSLSINHQRIEFEAKKFKLILLNWFERVLGEYLVIEDSQGMLFFSLSFPVLRNMKLFSLISLLVFFLFLSSSYFLFIDPVDFLLPPARKTSYSFFLLPFSVKHKKSSSVREVGEERERKRQTEKRERSKEKLSFLILPS